ncbi:MAG TPA: hemolysin III family protein [Pyrinomonadaceae bacterium]|nr:hemolysin III family protein [Pyrinomonadaceae bacterium]
MTKRIKTHLFQLPVEEFANTLTHGVGFLLSLLGFFALVALSWIHGDPIVIFGSVVYGISLVVLYGASTVYHSVTSYRAKKNLQIVDHCCIYLLIAGSYTPFGLVIAVDDFGRNLFLAVWAFAVIGIVIKLIIRDRWPALNVMSYLAMGWLGVFAVQPLWQILGVMPVVLTIAGGVAYSLGVIFFPWKSIKHHHAIFHIFILAGSIIHFAAVILYVIPHAANL